MLQVCSILEVCGILRTERLPQAFALATPYRKTGTGDWWQDLGPAGEARWRTERRCCRSTFIAVVDS